MNVSIFDILNQILLALLTFIVLPILRKISICRRWFLFVVSYYVNFQFTPKEQNFELECLLLITLV